MQLTSEVFNHEMFCRKREPFTLTHRTKKGLGNYFKRFKQSLKFISVDTER